MVTQSGACSFLGSSKHEKEKKKKLSLGKALLNFFSPTLLMAFDTSKSFDTSSKKSFGLGSGTQILVLTLPSYHRGPQFSPQGSKSKLKPC